MNNIWKFSFPALFKPLGSFVNINIIFNRFVFSELSYVFLKTFAILFDVVNQVNQIRDSLAIMGDNSTAFSLPQVNIGYCW